MVSTFFFAAITIDDPPPILGNQIGVITRGLISSASDSLQSFITSYTLRRNDYRYDVK